MIEKRAIILAGGKGTRLYPYTTVLPKPLMPIGEYTILEIIIKQLAEYGFTRITLTVNHQAELIKSFFGNGKRWNIEIDYSLEIQPLSTMGPLNLIKDLPDKFLVMNGDILTNLNFSKFYDSHDEKDLFTISSFEREIETNFGVLEVNQNQCLIKFEEKPVISLDVSMGIYMLSVSVLDHIPVNIKFGFDELMLSLIEKKIYPKVTKFDGYWLDIGRPDDYETASNEFVNSISEFISS
jgi:NDP-mannose synthase